MNHYTRRRLLVRGATLAGAAGAAPLLGNETLERALAAATTPSLSSDRRVTYAALVEAVALAGTSEVKATDLSGATKRFAAIYARDIDCNRRLADLTLDLLETSTGDKPFSAIGAHARLARLRGWVRGEVRAETHGMRHRVAVVDALRLAARPFDAQGPDAQITTPTI